MTPNDVCCNCGCARWKHNQYSRPVIGKRTGHCRRCGSLRCCQFRRNPKKGPTDVVAAVRAECGFYWICKRSSAGNHPNLANMWEYPGGKVEWGEHKRDALRREMMEEFRVRIRIVRELDTITSFTDGHEYRVTFFETLFTERPQLRIHSEVQWVTVKHLADYPHLPSGEEFNRR